MPNFSRPSNSKLFVPSIWDRDLIPLPTAYDLREVWINLQPTAGFGGPHVHRSREKKRRS
jgi:hypothetical protein